MSTNYAAIGQGIYDMLSEEHKAIVSFGMIPLEIIELFESNYKKVLVEKWCAKQGLTVDDFITDLTEEIPQEMVNDATHKVTIEIFTAAQKAGKMLV